MPRPKRLRCILSSPNIRIFGPEGVPEKGEVSLSLEEFEAIRHIDYKGLDQSRAAELMNVSRQTFGRILRSGRHRVADALVNACRLKVEGGSYTFDNDRRGHGHHGHGKGRGRCGRGRGQTATINPAVKQETDE